MKQIEKSLNKHCEILLIKNSKIMFKKNTNKRRGRHQPAQPI